MGIDVQIPRTCLKLRDTRTERGGGARLGIVFNQSGEEVKGFAGRQWQRCI